MDCSPTLLIVDDEYSVYYALSTCLDEKITIYHAPNGIETLSLLSKKSMDLVLLDYQLPGMNGIDLLKIIKQDYQIPVCFFTGYPSDELTAQLKQLEKGPDAYFTKPLDMPTFECVIAEYIKPKPSDKALIQAFAAGDRDAYDQLFHQYYQYACQRAYRLLKDKTHVQDIAQKAFLKIFKSASKFQPEAKFRPWLNKIVDNICKNCNTRNTLITNQDEFLLTLQDDRNDRIVEILANEELVNTVFGTLPPVDRKVFIDHYLYKMTYKEIGEKLRMTEKTVRNRAYEARKKLREFRDKF